MSYIEVSHISKSYGRKKILNDITFTADKGECIGIVGANGCGKSTLLKVLCGAHRPDSGDKIRFLTILLYLTILNSGTATVHIISKTTSKAVSLPTLE